MNSINLNEHKEIHVNSDFIRNYEQIEILILENIEVLEIDIGSLNQMKNLKELYLFRIGKININGSENCDQDESIKLEILEIKESNVVKVNIYFYMISINARFVNFCDNKIGKISNVPINTQIKILNLKNNNIKLIRERSLKHLTELEELILRDNEIEEIDIRWKTLKKIDLRRNPIKRVGLDIPKEQKMKILLSIDQIRIYNILKTEIRIGDYINIELIVN